MLSDDTMQVLPSQKPKRFDEWRLHAIVCLLLDAGLRIEEALTLRRSDVEDRAIDVQEQGETIKAERQRSGDIRHIVESSYERQSSPAQGKS